MWAMDYRLTDPHLDPVDGGIDALHTERLIRLPTLLVAIKHR